MSKQALLEAMSGDDDSLSLYLEITGVQEFRAAIKEILTPQKTLRDDFAADAMLIVAPAHSVAHSTSPWCMSVENFDALARDAYVLADSMLKAREA